MSVVRFSGIDGSNPLYSRFNKYSAAVLLNIVIADSAFFVSMVVLLLPLLSP